MWVFFLSKHGNLGVTKPVGSVEREVERKRLNFVSSILMTGSDIQLTLGIAYIITTLSQVQIMDLYHLHMVFDIVSFVGVSNTAALVTWRFCLTIIDDPDENLKGHNRMGISRFWRESRYRATFLFVALYLALLILLGIRLNDWAPDTAPGRCYFSHLVTSPSSSHPGLDQVYISVTGSWLIVVILAGVFAGVKRRRFVLTLSSLHFPLHLYMTIALRQANQGKFEGEVKHENEWDFGQTTAVLLLGIALVELVTKGIEFWNFESEAAKNGMSRLISERSLPEIEEARKIPSNASPKLGPQSGARS